MIEHPSAYLKKDVADRIRSAAAEAETLGRLHDHQLDEIYSHGWLNMYVPASYGGRSLDYPDILRVEEGLAWVDGSAAWVVTLCSGAAWFVGFLQPDIAREVFTGDKVCFAGSGAPTGIAQQRSGGYEVNGFWNYASGAEHATVFTANCVIHKDGKPLSNSDGTPVIRSFLMKREEVTIYRSWQSMGMVATGSHSFEVANLTLGENRSFIISPANATLPGRIFQYPFLSLAETTLAVNLSGMASRFVDLCHEWLAAKNVSARVMKTVHDAWHDLDRHRSDFYKAADHSWAICNRGDVIPPGVLERVSIASHALAERSRRITDALYPFCGLRAADTREEINRVWRNIHTASQHALFTAKAMAE